VKMVKKLSLYDFLQKNIGEKYFSQNTSGGRNVCLVLIPLIFSTRKELHSDLNAGRRGVQGQLYGKTSEEARKGPE